MPIFNPYTTIEFVLIGPGFAELNVFNISGKKVSTPVSKRLNRSKYGYTFNGKSLPGGIYFSQLLPDKYREVRKMTIVK